MDEKGFAIGTGGRSKRIFDKQLYEKKEVTTGVQDGSREWITILACICADGTALPPSIIFKSKSGDLQSVWVDKISESEEPAFVAALKRGWTNDKIGVAWLKEVFEPFTRPKTPYSYRLLIIDGHSSHITQEFWIFAIKIGYSWLYFLLIQLIGFNP